MINQVTLTIILMLGIVFIPYLLGKIKWIKTEFEEDPAWLRGFYVIIVGCILTILATPLIYILYLIAGCILNK